MKRFFKNNLLFPVIYFNTCIPFCFLESASHANPSSLVFYFFPGSDYWMFFLNIYIMKINFIPWFLLFSPNYLYFNKLPIDVCGITDIAYLLSLTQVWFENNNRLGNLAKDWKSLDLYMRARVCVHSKVKRSISQYLDLGDFWMEV